jgi:ATP-dependent Clp protease ATP-binding subunit ClpC
LIGKRVIGQAEAVQARWSTAVATGCSSRCPAGPAPADRARSWSSGPTGVGKTELTKALAEYLFDDETALFRSRHVGVHGESTRSRG